MNLLINSPVLLSFINLSGAIDSIADGWTDILNSCIDLITQMWKATTNNGLTGKAFLSYLNIDSTNVVYSTMLTYSKNIYDVIAIFGWGLMLTYWMAGIIDKLSKDRLSINTLMKAFIELIVASGIIINGFILFQAIANTGTWAANKISNVSITEVSGEDTAPYNAFFVLGTGKMANSIEKTNGPITAESLKSVVKTDYKDVCTNMGKSSDFSDQMAGFAYAMLGAMSFLIECVLAVIIAALYFLINRIVFKYAITIAISRAVQFCIYTCMAPIGMAQWFNRGGLLDSSGMTYIRKVAAVIIQGPILMLIVKIKLSLAVGVGQSEVGALILLIALEFVSFALINKSQQFANDVVGT